MRFFDLSGDYVDGDDVFLDSIYHVIVGSLKHQLKVMLVLDHRKLILRAHNHVCLTEQAILYLVLLVSLLFKPLLEFLELSLLLSSDLIDVVVLDPKLSEGVTDFPLLLVSGLPRGYEIVRL